MRMGIMGGMGMMAGALLLTRIAEALEELVKIKGP